MNSLRNYLIWPWDNGSWWVSLSVTVLYTLPRLSLFIRLVIFWGFIGRLEKHVDPPTDWTTFRGGTIMGNKQYREKCFFSQKQKLKIIFHFYHIIKLPFHVYNIINLLDDYKSSLSIKSLAAGNWLSFRSIHFRALNCSALHICHFATSNSGLS